MVFKKGDPTTKMGGRPKGAISIVDAIKQKLREPDPERRDNGIYLDSIVDVIVEKAHKDKDVAMLKDMIDRVDGKANQRTETTLKGDEDFLKLVINNLK